MFSKENIWCACVGGAGREKWLRNKQQMCAGKPSRTPCKSVYARKWTSQSCLRATHTHFHSLIGNEVKHKWKKPNALKCNLTTPPPKQTQSSRSLWLPAVKWNRYQCWCARASKHSTQTHAHSSMQKRASSLCGQLVCAPTRFVEQKKSPA